MVEDMTMTTGARLALIIFPALVGVFIGVGIGFWGAANRHRRAGRFGMGLFYVSLAYFMTGFVLLRP
jgi:ABC-type dipeptide/oligopeptide/nickel transport system permease component